MEAPEVTSTVSDTIGVVEKIDRLASNEAQQIANEKHQELTQQECTLFCIDQIKAVIRIESNTVKCKRKNNMLSR